MSRRNRLLIETLEVRRLLHAPGSPVWQLATDHDVIAINGFVARWLDQSGSNDVFASGSQRPAVLKGSTPNGSDAIRFDGVDDQLIRTISTGISELPTDGADRSLFVVAQFHDANALGGIAYGTGEPNQAFGIGVTGPDSNEGKLVVQGFGAENDLVSSIPGYEATDSGSTGWMVLSAIISGSSATLYVGQTEVATWDVAHTYSTSLNDSTLVEGQTASRIAIGAGIDGVGNIMLDLAAIVLYDEAVAPALRTRIVNYLNSQYLTSDNGLDALGGSFATTMGEPFAFAAATLIANDNLGSQPTSVVHVTANSTEGGAVTLSSDSGLYVYTPPAGFVGSDTFFYTIRDGSSRADTASVTVVINAAPVDLIIPDASTPIASNPDTSSPIASAPDTNTPIASAPDTSAPDTSAAEIGVEELIGGREESAVLDVSVIPVRNQLIAPVASIVEIAQFIQYDHVHTVTSESAVSGHHVGSPDSEPESQQDHGSNHSPFRSSALNHFNMPEGDPEPTVGKSARDSSRIPRGVVDHTHDDSMSHDENGHAAFFAEGNSHHEHLDEFAEIERLYSVLCDNSSVIDSGPTTNAPVVEQGEKFAIEASSNETAQNNVGRRSLVSSNRYASHKWVSNTDSPVAQPTARSRGLSVLIACAAAIGAYQFERKAISTSKAALQLRHRRDYQL